MVVRAETGLLGTSERQLEGLMTSCCESCILTHLHPHTAISITLQIENNQGSVSYLRSLIEITMSKIIAI